MKYRRMPIEIESPEELGYRNIRCNLAESSVMDAKWSELGIRMDELVLAYTDHRGKKELRELIAKQYYGIDASDVLLTPGAAAGLFIAATALLEREDHLVVQFPNYSSNLETPYAIGCKVSKAEARFENGFRLDLEEIEKRITPATRLISLTSPGNPAGQAFTHYELARILDMASHYDCYVLVDETYRDLCFGEKTPLAASLAQHAISISSISKAHGLPGLRMGWMITVNRNLQEIFLAAKEQILICNSALDEEVCFRYLQNSAARETQVKEHVQTNFSIVEAWLQNHPFLEWVKPTGGCVCFPRFKKDANVDVEKFYHTLKEKYGTHVGPGHWFGMEKNYFRLGFGWPPEKELREGLKAIDASAAIAAGK